MNLLLVFLLGVSTGALWMAIRAQTRYKEQTNILRQYHAMLQSQLDRSRELLFSHQELLTENRTLRERCLRLELQRERLLASLN